MAPSHGSSGALFLSYAHNDNEPLVQGQTGWVENFQHALKVRLKQLLGREPDLWWDLAQMRGNEVLTSAIGKGVDRSAVLVAVVSPSYIDFERSDWCRKELESFCLAAERAGGVAGDVRNRIFKVVKTFVSLNLQPPPLKELRGYEFFRKDPTTGRLREFFLQDSAPVDPDYIKKIDDLAEDIHLFLESLKEPVSPKPTPADAVTAPVLYLAETTSDLAADRDQIVRMLRQTSYCVLPDQELPLAHGAELREYVRGCLQRARLSIHLIGANYGAIPEGETESVAVLQNELAAERSGDRSFCRLIWMPADLRTPDERQRLFVERLRNDSEAQRGAEILQGSLAELGTVIQSRLQPRGNRDPEVRSVATGDDLKNVYVMCDQRDREACEALRDLLYARHPRLEVWLPPFEGDETDVRALHREYLTFCDGVLLYFGGATESWLLTKLCELKKVAGYGRERPFSAKAIYLAPPASPAKKRFRTREALVIQDAGEPPIEALAPFLQQLGIGPTS